MNTSHWARLLAVIMALTGCSESKNPQQELMSAVVSGDVRKVESLVDDPNIDVNWKGPRSGTNALSAAASHNQLDALELLLRRGANPNIEDAEGGTPLLYAAYHGYADIVVRLIEAGADVNRAEDRFGYTPLASAARRGHVEVIRLLLDAGAKRHVPVKDGRRPLDLAVQEQHANAANVLRVYQPQPASSVSREP